MRKRELKNIEWSILIFAILLSIIGLVKTVSLGNQDEYVEVKNIDKKCASLKKTMSTMGLSASDETVQNVVRILQLQLPFFPF